MSKEKRILDNTTISTFHSCPQKYYFSCVRGLKRGDKQSPALVLGQAIHKGLEHLYLGDDLEKSIEEFHQEYDKSVVDSKRTPENGEKILRAYYDKYFPEKQWKVLGVEEGFVFPIHDKLSFYGQGDLRVEYMGKCFFVEHKTSSNFNWFVENPNNQISGYTYGGKELGYDLAGVIVNILGVYKTKTDFKRTVTFRSDEQLADWLKMVIDTYNKIVECEETNTYPKYNTSCWNCQYRELCSTSEENLERLIEFEWSEEFWRPWENEGVTYVK